MAVLFASLGHAEEPPKGIQQFQEFNEKPLEGWVWDEDERLNDLVLQLQQKELALQEIDTRIANIMGKKWRGKMAENMAWRSTQRMDLNGGGPIRWDAFYGRNAENFFYHPKDPNTTYHTNTVLQQMPSTTAGGVPGNQSVPAHQRPPQFDYIYRGYEQAQAKAREEAKALAEKLDVMKARRRELENDVVILWFKLAFRVIDRDDLADKPVLRWAVAPKDDDGQDGVERAAALTAAAQVVATAMLFNEASAESDPEKSYSTISELMKKHRKSFSDSLLRLASLRTDEGDKTKPIGQFKLLASRLEDAAKSLEEGYQDWKEGDDNDEEKTKFQGLRRIQDSLVQYAKLVLALNELVGVMKRDWAIEPNLDSTEFIPTWDVTYVPKTLPEATTTTNPVVVDLLKQVLDNPPAGTMWQAKDGLLICVMGGPGNTEPSKARSAVGSNELARPVACDGDYVLTIEARVRNIGNPAGTVQIYASLPDLDGCPVFVFVGRNMPGEKKVKSVLYFPKCIGDLPRPKARSLSLNKDFIANEWHELRFEKKTRENKVAIWLDQQLVGEVCASFDGMPRSTDARLVNGCHHNEVTVRKWEIKHLGQR